ncbi:MAG: DUF5063 domain-containing protein [Odoribacter sp.]|nr:DUF5063 domain-containing protein [Odoribacter sp.]
MDSNSDPVYSRHVVEFVAVANEYCKYAEHAHEIKGEELFKILQRLLPLLYLKASFLPEFTPYFEDGNEKFVTETDWTGIQDAFKKQFGSANDYLEVFDERINESENPVVASLAENMADIYQDLKDFILLYQTGTIEVMNDAVWECRMNFESYWGQKLVNALRAIHKFVCSGEAINEGEMTEKSEDGKRDKSDWFISRRQKEFRDDDE